MSVPSAPSSTATQLQNLFNAASGGTTSTLGLPVTPSAAYPPASFVTTPNITLPASITNFLTSNQNQNLAWIRQAFMLNTLGQNGTLNDISAQDMARRIFTTAAWKYTDTTLGGNWPINCPPQFTEFSDITMGGDATWQNAPDRTTLTTQGSFGMGRAYSEVLDDNAQLITMSFGVQAFNSLASFFGNFYDPKASALVRTGRAESIFFQIGSAAGYLLSIPFKPIIFGSQVIKSALNIPSTKFSYFKPTMPLYWNSVNTILNAITANIGVHNRSLNSFQQAMYQDPNAPSGSNTTQDISADLAAMSKFLPDIYIPTSTNNNGQAQGGYIDVYAVANRAQRLSDQFTKNIQAALDQATSGSNLQSLLLNVIGGNMTRPATTYLSGVLNNYLNQPGGTANGNDTGDTSGTVESMEQDSDSGVPSAASSSNTGGTSGATGTPTNNSTATPTSNSANTGSAVGTAPNGAAPPDATQSNGSLSGAIASWWNQWWDDLKADLADGSNYITFRTDYGGTIGESFSSSTKPSDLQSQINSKSSDARMVSFDLAGGNLMGGVLGSIVGGAVDAVKDTIAGVGAGLHLSGLAALAGAAYVDIPNVYDSSTVTLPNQTFTIELRSWSGHKLALLQNIYLPLACLLAAVMPRATGAASWNAPFSCQLFAKGRMQIRNGIVSDMTITRGTGNVGWTADNLPLGIDVTFTVTDYSTMMYMPIVANTGTLDTAIMGAGDAIGTAVGAAGNALGLNTNASQGGAAGTSVASYLTSGPYSDYSLFSDYLAVLGALDWQDQVYPMRKWSIARDRAVLDYDTFKSPAHAAGWANGTLIGQVISGLVKGTDRP
jgi:hypothetical protein